MKRTVLALALATAAAVPGMAADLPSRAPPPVFVPPPPIFTWTGFYIGGVAGVDFAVKDNLRNPTAPLATARNINNNGNNHVGFTGGGEIGYNYQIGSFVLGVEGDGDYIDLRSKNSNTTTTLTRNTYRAVIGNPGNAFGTARARVGYAWDRLLLFVTGGGAFSGGYGATSVTFRPNVAGAPLQRYTAPAVGGTQVGFSVGGGIEYAIFGNWSIKGEYLFNSLGDNTLRFTHVPANGRTFTAKVDNQFSIARLGVNYRF